MEKRKKAAIQLGNTSAAAILELRKDDGHLAKGDYKPGNKPGSYQYTPGFDWVWIPDLKKIKPFGVVSTDQFRAAPPPALSSSAYAESFNEVKAYGVANSKLRTSEETSYAHWWAEFARNTAGTASVELRRGGAQTFVVGNSPFICIDQHGHL